MVSASHDETPPMEASSKLSGVTQKTVSHCLQPAEYTAAWVADSAVGRQHTSLTTGGWCGMTNDAVVAELCVLW